ncbi:putative aromatic ring-opening dioxygenase LigB subunit [Xylariomycetidae sp. FL2044]|nr:putative aromatic ring-opening dioxygenase LigB subunit [Xylariomycetidae sp. FL2044]
MSVTPPRTPVYFLGIGGPSFMENVRHPAYIQLQKVGREITTRVKPQAVVVFSAHWQDGPSRVSVNVADDAGIIYDFYGFPSRYYEHKYPYRGSPEVAGRIMQRLSGAGIQAQRVNRGLDHGVWVGFMAAFHPQDNPLNVPIVQVSLYGNEDTKLHYRMGEALQGLRDEGVLIVGAGMAAQSARFPGYEGDRYGHTFDEALREAVESEPESREAKMHALTDRIDAAEAHPSMEHLLPVYVAAGAAGTDTGRRLWTLPEGSLSWAQFRFGEISGE